MSIRGSSSTRPATLGANIRAIEVRIRQRRDSIDVACDNLAESLREKLISPPALIAAGLVGAAMHRSQLPNRFQLMAIMQTAITVARRVLTAT